MMLIPRSFLGDKNAVNWKGGQFFKADVETGDSARINVNKNTRAYRVRFDGAPVYEYVVRPPSPDAQQGSGGRGDLKSHCGGGGVGGRKGMQEGYEVGPTGVKMVRLWSRTWGREFELDVEWCNYATSDSSSGKHSRSSKPLSTGALPVNGPSMRARW